MRISDISISKKIGLAFAIVVIGAAAMGFAVRSNMTTIEAERVVKAAHSGVIVNLLEARGALSRQENSLRGFLITRDDYYSGRVDKHFATFGDRTQAIRVSPVMDPATLAKLDTIDAGMKTWHDKIAEQAIAAAREPMRLAFAQSLIVSDEASALIDPVEEALDALRDEQNAAIAAAEVEQIGAYSMAQVTLFASIVGLITVAIALAMMLSRGIAGPVVLMRDAMSRLAAGETTIAVPALGRKDEVGQMAEAFEHLRQVSVEAARLENEAEGHRRSQEIQAREEELRSAGYVEAHAFFMAEVQKGFERLSGGDLLVRLDRPFSEDYEGMRSLFNESVGKLEEAIGTVVHSIGAIRTGLTEISVASNDLAQRTEQQAANLEETVAALSEVTGAVHETAEGATRAQTSAATAQRNAEKGGEIVGRAVEAMNQIEQSSEKISKIIGVIDEIAFQTNLLALNAGVEAARAGEAGRGFAVVAQEVRGLAQRSAEAAKEIKTLISTSRSQVQAGVSLVSASGKSLDEIVAQVGDMSQEVAGIAKSAREQAVSLREVSTAADQMDKVTQQNAAMVEETTAAAQMLTTETDGLSDQIARFRTSAGASAPKTARSAPVPAAARRSAQRPVAQMRTSGQGGAQPKPQAAADGWEEF